MREYRDFDLTATEIRRMSMRIIVVPARLVKLMRLVNTFHSKGKNNV
jgi:hypothetical protein